MCLPRSRLKSPNEFFVMVQAQEQLRAARAQLREHAAAATAAAANLDLLRERCARLEEELAHAHAVAAEAVGGHIHFTTNKWHACPPFYDLPILNKNQYKLFYCFFAHLLALGSVFLRAAVLGFHSCDCMLAPALKKCRRSPRKKMPASHGRHCLT